MLPDRPGTYRVRYRGYTHHVDFLVDIAPDPHTGKPALCVLDELGSSSPTPWTKCTVRHFTELLETLGGEWVERIENGPT